MKTLMMALLLGGISACGPQEIPIGKTFSDTVTRSDNFWTSGERSAGTFISGYAKDYVVNVTQGAKYTVRWGTDNGYGNFEDQEHGDFVTNGLDEGSTIPDASESSPSTSIWTPAMTGMNKVDADAQIQNVPFRFTILITAQ